MSLKSQKRRTARAERRATGFVLLQQKDHIQRAMLDYLFASLFFQAMVIVAAGIGLTAEDHVQRNGIFFLGVPIVLACATGFTCLFVRCWKIFRAIKDIQYSSEEAVVIRCKKVSILLRNESKYSNRILCIIFRAEEGQFYYYVYPTERAPSDFVVKQLRRQLQGKNLTLTCYRDTYVVKDFPDVPIC